MTGPEPRQPLTEFTDELRLLAEAVLERVEPVLRQAAAEEQPEWNNCTWCPVCAAAALVRGEHHEVLAAVAAHGTAIVTVLREALAGVPVDPIPHDHGPRAARHQQDAHAADEDRAGATPDHDDAAQPRGGPARSDTGTTSDRSRYVGIPVNIKS